MSSKNEIVLDVKPSVSKMTFSKVTITVDQINEEVIKCETIPPDIKLAIKNFLESLPDRVIYSMEDFRKLDVPTNLEDVWPWVQEIVKALFS